MIYNNLIYMLVGLAILTVAGPPGPPVLPGFQVLLLFLLKAWLFWQTIRFYLRVKGIRSVPEYFAAERIFAVVALILFGLDVYLFDLRAYLALLPFSGQFPALATMAGIGVFLLYLALLWLQLRESYGAVVGVRPGAMAHVGAKLRLCLAPILPWLLGSLLYDLLLLAPAAGMRAFMTSPWGEALFLLVMLVATVVWFPAALVRLYGCTAMPAGPGRHQLEEFCRQQGVRFGGILLWPLVEGKVLTAGVVGVVGRYRYLLITPSLLATLSPGELEGVVAHELGHVKKHHLLLYLLLFLGLAIFLQLWLQPLLSLVLATGLFSEVLLFCQGASATLLSLLATGLLVLLLWLYVRYVFGFFMRNFERQADGYSFRTMGSATPLISVLQKIARLSGTGRESSCWHHYSIGQRIDYLANCQRNSALPRVHDYKVYSCLAGYFLTLALALFMLMPLGARSIATHSGQQLAEEVIMEKVAHDPDNPLWHQFHGDLLAARKDYPAAIKAFEQSLRLYPDNPEVLNNLAWLLLTVEKQKMLDSVRALALAKKAVALKARSHILDTLAEAYWQNGRRDLAMATAQRALTESSDNQEYYRRQLQKFTLNNRS